ncbi:MAG: OmpA family protein [Bacteroidetes bacterium]|nr:OmpA family protein [Bacteroidota bacterium]
MRTFLICLFSFTAITLSAQQVQWASEVVRFSTEYTRKQFAARQVLGKPDKLPAFGESAVAWAPSTPDNPAGEFIHVRFAQPQQIQQVGIGESNCPGSVKEVILYSTTGKKYTVYENLTIKPEFTTGGRIFRVFFPLTDYEVSEVRVVLNTKAIPGMNQIDCIGISNSDVPIKATVNEAVYANPIADPENLGPNVNTDADDMFAFISPDGKTLYFARKNYYENTGGALRDDIYVSKNANGAWTKAVNIGTPLNNDQHNYVSWISSDGSSLLLANNYEKVKQDISISKRTPDGWAFPKALKINDFYNDNEFSCYHMNTEGNVILMAIERPDSYGDMDIYVSFLQANKVWTEPKNLGMTINSAATEGSIFIAADNRTIYFATNGKSGYGGYDMFMSKRLDDTWLNWSEPVNLGNKINSEGHDYYYTIPASGDYAYFSSTKNSYGKADLFRIPLPVEIQPEAVTLLKGKVIDANTKEPINADVQFGGLVSEEPKGITTTTNGNYQVIIPEENYNVTIKKEGYYPVTTTIDEDLEFDEIDYNVKDPVAIIKHDIKTDIKTELKQNKWTKTELIEELNKRIETEFADTAQVSKEAIVKEIADEITTAKDSVYAEVTADVELIPIRAGTVIQLDNIFFEANKSDLKPESSASLDELAEFLLSNPNIYVEIGGHTNGLPNDAFCQKLSDERAKNVVAYLMAKGVPATHLTSRGYGKTQPIADNATAAGRKKNQRVELKIIKVE